MPQTGKRIATTKISQNRTTTVPEAIRTAEGLSVGDEVDWHIDGGRWVVQPAQPPPDVTCDILEEYVGRPCEDCDSGELERTTLDGDDVVACTDCETIRAALWKQ